MKINFRVALPKIIRFLERAVTDKVIWMFFSTEDLGYFPEVEAELDDEKTLMSDFTPLEYHLFDQMSLLYSLHEVPLNPTNNIVFAIEKDMIPELGITLPPLMDQEIITLNSRGELFNYEIEDFRLDYRLDEEAIEAILNEDAIFFNDTVGLGFIWLTRNFPQNFIDIH